MELQHSSETARSHTQGKRTIQAMTWGLVPSWTKDSETKLDFFRYDVDTDFLYSEGGHREVLSMMYLEVLLGHRACALQNVQCPV